MEEGEVEETALHVWQQRIRADGAPFNVVAGALPRRPALLRASLLCSVPPVEGWTVVVGSLTAMVASEATALQTSPV